MLCPDFPARTAVINGKTLELRLLVPQELGACLALQQEIVEKVTAPPVFEPSVAEDYLESMEKDFALGLWDGDTLAAQCLCVRNRVTDRNLCLKFNSQDYAACLTFDTVQVHPAYQGSGIQKRLLREAEQLARAAGASYIAATVSPENPASLRSFLACGFVCDRQLPLYGGERFLMKKLLEQTI